VPRVSTSPQKGATISRARFRSGSGVKLDKAASKVIFPLLFTKQDVRVTPKKLIGNGKANLDDEPSSLRGSVFSKKPALGRIAWPARPPHRAKVQKESRRCTIALTTCLGIGVCFGNFGTNSKAHNGLRASGAQPVALLRKRTTDCALVARSLCALLRKRTTDCALVARSLSLYFESAQRTAR